MSGVERKSPLSAGALLMMVKASMRKHSRIIRKHDGVRVVVVPCGDGQIRITGLAPDGKWVAEWACRAEDWRDSMVDRMAVHVRHSRSVGIPRLKAI